MSKRTKKQVAAVGFHKDENGVAGVLMLAEPVACKCGAMAFMLVNRLGSTRCVTCDMNFVKNMSPEDRALAKKLGER